MTTVDQIRSAYSNTLQCSCGHKIEDLFAEPGVKLTTIFNILKYMRLENSPFGYAGTLGNFLATYKMGEFEIVFQAFDSNNNIRVHTVESFAKWLNDCERRILEAAKSLGE